MRPHWAARCRLRIACAGTVVAVAGGAAPAIARQPLSGNGRGHAVPVVSLYGAAHSFGGLASHRRLPTGQRFRSHAVPGWRFLPGEAAYFTTVGPDGTVFIANEPQTDDQLEPTARQMAISAFTPSHDAFRNIVIPTSTGVTSVAGPWPSASLAVGGGDVADLVPTSVQGSSRIAFLSAMPYEGWNIAADGVYPTLGYLSDQSGRWSYDAPRSVSALSIARSATAQTGQPCAPETNLDAQRFADCRLPAEMAVLPQSHDLIVTQYASRAANPASGSLMALNPDGTVLATYPYPRITLPDGEAVDVHPREVDADPTSPSGDEHFVVIFDTTTGSGAASQLGPFAMQEFRFSASTDSIRALSAPILSGDTAPDGELLGFETAGYDRTGDLWAAQTEDGTLTGGPIAVYRRQANGSTIARPGCEAPAQWSGTGWGTWCMPNAQIRQSSTLGPVRSLNLDPGTGAMLIATMSGYLLPVLTADDDRRLSARTPVNLGLNELANRTDTALDLRKGAVDPTTHTLYLPVQQLQTERHCPDYPCMPTRLNQWLYGIDLNSLVGPSPR